MENAFTTFGIDVTGLEDKFLELAYGISKICEYKAELDKNPDDRLSNDLMKMNVEAVEELAEKFSVEDFDAAAALGKKRFAAMVAERNAGNNRQKAEEEARRKAEEEYEAEQARKDAEWAEEQQRREEENEAALEELLERAEEAEEARRLEDEEDERLARREARRRPNEIIFDGHEFESEFELKQYRDIKFYIEETMKWGYPPSGMFISEGMIQHFVERGIIMLPYGMFF